MGNPITYCASCGTQIKDKDFASREAFRLDSRAFCRKCGPAALKSLPPDKMQEILAQITTADSHKRTSEPRLPVVPSTRRAPQPPRPPSRTGIVGLSLVAAILVLVAVIAVSSRPPPATPVAAEPPGPRADNDLRRREAEAMQSDLKSLETQVVGWCRTESFSKAVQTLGAARARRTEPAWTQAIDRLAAETRSQAQKLLPAVKADAVEAKRKGSSDDVKKLKDRVAQWGLPELAADLTTALAAVPEPTPFFNGKDLTGFEVRRGTWTVEEGMVRLVALDDKNAAHLRSFEELEDYDLEGSIEFLNRGYIEIQIYGAAIYFEGTFDPGWRSLKIVARGGDVQCAMDGKPMQKSVKQAGVRRGLLGFYSRALLRLKDFKILRRTGP